MNISNQFSQVNIFLAEDGLVSVLEKLSLAFVTAIEINGIPREESSHQRGYGLLAGSEKEVGMIRNKCPSTAHCPGCRQKLLQPLQEILTVRVVPEYLCTIYSSDDDVMQRPRAIKSR